MQLKTWFLLLYLFSNVKSELIYLHQLVLQHQTVTRDFKSSNRNATVGFVRFRYIFLPSKDFVGLQSIFKTCLEHFFNVTTFPSARTSSRRLARWCKNLLRWRRLQDVFKTRLEDVFKTYWRPTNVSLECGSWLIKAKENQCNWYKWIAVLKILFFSNR